MGHTSKKKKKGGGNGRRIKGRTHIIGHSSDTVDDNELLSKEITDLQVRHLDAKKEKEVERGNLVTFLLDAIATQFRKPSLWN